MNKIDIIKNLDYQVNAPKTENSIFSLIQVGLEYGDNNYDGKSDNTTIEEKYPNIEKALTE